MLGPSISEIVHTEDSTYNHNILGNAIEELTDVQSNFEHNNDDDESIGKMNGDVSNHQKSYDKVSTADIEVDKDNEESIT